MINGSALVSRLAVLLFAVPCGALFGGCAVENQEPGAVHAEVAPGIGEQSTGLGTGLVGGLTAAVGICTPLTCCFPTGAEWGDNPFENGLNALGCTMPAAYTEKSGGASWYLYSQCPAGPKVDALVAAYSNVEPYDAQLVSNLCLTLNAVGKLQLDTVFVEFDPTCASCQPARK